MNESCAPLKNAFTAIILCAFFLLLLPFVLVRFFPAVAEIINNIPFLLMLPILLIYTIMVMISGSWYISKDDFKGIGYTKTILKSFGIIIIAAVCAVLWISLLEILRINYSTDVPVEEFIKSCSPAEQIFAAVYICIITPILEETIFRRIIFEGLRSKFQPVFSMTVTSLLFAALHGIMFQLFPLFILGFCFQLLYVADNKSGPPIIAHAFNNSMAFAMLLLTADM